MGGMPEIAKGEITYLEERERSISHILDNITLNRKTLREKPTGSRMVNQRAHQE